MRNCQRLLINAVGLRAGGGPTIGLNVLSRIRTLAPTLQVCALVPDRQDYVDVCEACGFEYHTYSADHALYDVWRLWFDQYGVNAHARRFRPDVIFSMGNQGPIHAQVPHVILFHNSYYIYPPEAWGAGWGARQRLSFAVQRSVFRRCVAAGAYVVTQTEVAARRVADQYGADAAHLTVAGSAASQEYLFGILPTDRWGIGERAGGRLAVGVISRYYPHKQIDRVVECALRVRDAGADPFLFVLTIEAKDHPHAAAVLARIEAEKLHDRVMNIGFIPSRLLGSLYAQLNAMMLPSRLESLSSTYLEAMATGVPIVTSDLDFARDTCGDAALYIDPDRLETWEAALLALKGEPGLADALKEKGRIQLARKTQSYDEVVAAYLAFIDRAAGEARGTVLSAA